MQTLKYVIGKDYRPLTTLEAKSSNVSNIDYGNNPNWVQGRQHEDGLRQVFVEITNEDGSPFDLTGANVLFEGILPDGEHKILDNSHAVFYEDPAAGKFRFDLPAAAFAVAGQYKQAFFRITKGYQNVATLEFRLEILADMVISGLMPRDYISPLEDFFTEIKRQSDASLTELKNKETQGVADLKAIVDAKINEINNLMTALNTSNQSVVSELATSRTLLLDLQKKIKEDGLFTKYEADNLFEEFEDKAQQLSQKVDTSMSEAKTLVENKIAQIDNGVHAYANSDAIKAKYPGGAQGVFVAVDTGHQWYYVNGNWADAGVYQAAQPLDALESPAGFFTPGNTTIQDANNAKGNTVYRLVSDINATDGIVKNTPFGDKWGTASTCLLITLGENKIGATQHFIVTGDGKPKIYQRAHSTNWSPWKLVYASNASITAPYVYQYGLNGDGVSDPITDLNNVRENRVSIFLNTKNAKDIPANTPFGNTWETVNPVIFEQIGTGMNGTIQTFEIYKGQKWQRQYSNDHWQPWSEIYNLSLNNPFSVGTNKISDFDTFDEFGEFPLLQERGSTSIPANSPWEKWPTASTIYFTQYMKGDQVTKIQRLFDSSQGVTWYRTNSYISGNVMHWNAWRVANGKNAVVVDKNGAGLFTKFKDAVEFAMKYTPEHQEVIVRPGTYDLIEEFGDDYFANIKSTDGEQVGLSVGGGLKISADAGAKIVAHYTGDNGEVDKRFSPLNHSIEGGIELNGLNIETSRTRYVFHDECYGLQRSETIVKNCVFKKDNTQSTWASSQCIGGGLGRHSKVTISGSIFTSGSQSEYILPVTYHGNGLFNDAEGYISITNSYFDALDNKKVGVRFGYYGESTLKTKVRLSGNSWSRDVAHVPENSTSTVDNFEIVAFNNELRGGES